MIVSWNLLSTNIPGHTKRAVADGIWFTVDAAGNVAGAKIFPAREAPSALTGLPVCYPGIIVQSMGAFSCNAMGERKERCEGGCGQLNAWDCFSGHFGWIQGYDGHGVEAF